jgi:hypothetical protein
VQFPNDLDRREADGALLFEDRDHVAKDEDLRRLVVVILGRGLDGVRRRDPPRPIRAQGLGDAHERGVVVPSPVVAAVGRFGGRGADAEAVVPRPAEGLSPHPDRPFDEVDREAHDRLVRELPDAGR